VRPGRAAGAGGERLAGGRHRVAGPAVGRGQQASGDPAARQGGRHLAGTEESDPKLRPGTHAAPPLTWTIEEVRIIPNHPCRRKCWHPPRVPGSPGKVFAASDRPARRVTHPMSQTQDVTRPAPAVAPAPARTGWATLGELNRYQWFVFAVAAIAWMA